MSRGGRSGPVWLAVGRMGVVLIVAVSGTAEGSSSDEWGAGACKLVASSHCTEKASEGSRQVSQVLEVFEDSLLTFARHDHRMGTRCKVFALTAGHKNAEACGPPKDQLVLGLSNGQPMDHGRALARGSGWALRQSQLAWGLQQVQ